MRVRRRQLTKVALLCSILLAAGALGAPSSVAAGVHSISFIGGVSLLSDGHPNARAQLIITSCPTPNDCRVDLMFVEVCMAAWDGSGYFTLGSCKDGSKSKSQQTPIRRPQVTVNKHLIGCTPGLRYAAAGKAAWIEGMNNYLIPSTGGYYYFPPSGGVALC